MEDNMRLIMRIIISALLVISILSLTTMAYAEESESERQEFHYAHDPRDDPNAMKDIIVNSDAVYGFSPNPDSTRLGEYAGSIDWTDPDQVAEARQQRADYLASMSELYRMVEEMLGQAKPVEEIARAVSKRRNELRLEAYNDDPDGLETVKKSNLETYGHEEGPDADELYEKYGSWQLVLEKALSTNAGMDACLGFYDDNYYTYDVEAALEASEKPKTAHKDISQKMRSEKRRRKT
jgi:hypothetical protein